MAWAYRRPGDPTSGQVWVDADDPNAIPDTVPIPGHDDPANAQQITGQTPEEYAKNNPWVTNGTPDGTPDTSKPVQYQTWGTNRYEGWDQSKIAANHDSPKYQVGRVLSNFDPRQGITPEVLAALNALGLGTFEGSGQNLRVVNASPEFEGYTDWGDMIHGFEGGAGANAAWQYGINNSRDVPGGGGGPLVPYNPHSGLGYTQGIYNSSSSGGGLALSPEDQQIQAEARRRILDLLRTPQTVDPATLRDSPEMQAVYLQEQRAEERDRAALAERAAAGGWSGSGGFEGGLTALREKRGATEMQIVAQLAVTQMERNREDLKAGIEFALQQGQFDQAQALQRELAALEAAIEREKIAANLDLGFGELDLRRYLGNLQSGFDYTQLEAQTNQNILEWLARNRPGA